MAVRIRKKGRLWYGYYESKEARYVFTAESLTDLLSLMAQEYRNRRATMRA